MPCRLVRKYQESCAILFFYVTLIIIVMEGELHQVHRILMRSGLWSSTAIMAPLVGSEPEAVAGGGGGGKEKVGANRVFTRPGGG